MRTRLRTGKRGAADGAAPLRAVASRAMTLPVTSGAGLLTVSLTVAALGVEDYGLVSLLLTLQLLLPFMDLGTGAAVLNAAGAHAGGAARLLLRDALAGALRVTLVTSLVAFVGACLLAVSDQWPSILGVPGDSRVTRAVVMIMAVNVVARPLVLFSTVLIGLGRAAAVIYGQALAAIAALGVVWGAAEFGGSFSLFSVAAISGQAVVGGFMCLLVDRAAPGLVADSCRTAMLRRGKPTVRNLHGTAGPMLAVNLLAPMGMYLDRLILSHVSTPSQLSLYAIAAQLFQPLHSLVVAAQPPLWADFATRRARGDGRNRVRLLRLTIVMASAAAVAGVLFAALAPLAASLVTGGRVELPFALGAAFAPLLLLAAAQSPSGMMLTNAAGLRRQAIILCGAVSLNLGMTVILAARMGAPGPVWGSVAGAVLTLATSLPLALRESGRLDASAIEKGVKQH